MLAKPVTMTYKGEKDHPTNLGGFLSFIILTLVCLNLFDRISVVVFKTGDSYSQSNISYKLKDNHIKLTNEALDFQIYFVKGGKQQNFDSN